MFLRKGQSNVIIRQLSKARFQAFELQLIRCAQQNPMDAGYNVTIKNDGKEYILKIQPESDCRLAVLQALEVERDDEYGQLHTLITNSSVLSSLLERLLEAV